MRVYYPNGVKKGHPAYESKHDRDKDGWACEG
ncbi:excalibur calcium-binding domain-containing protein [bacterium LRH843]|nr:excalibur calcium-binding domain-containing protein [bacterium LRH843]